jgi:hypothetical protein
MIVSAASALCVFASRFVLQGVHGLIPIQDLAVVGHAMDALQANSRRHPAQRPGRRRATD